MAQSTFNFTTAGICESMKTSILTKFPGLRGRFMKPNGLIKMLLSEQNRLGFNASDFRIRNKARMSTIVWEQLEDSATISAEAAARTCDDTGCESSPRFEEEPELDQYIGTCISEDVESVLQYCDITDMQSVSDFMTEQIGKKIISLTNQMDFDIATDLVAKTGLNLAQGDNLIRPLDILAPTGTILANGFTSFEVEYSDHYPSDDYLLVGRGNVEKAAKLLEIACCNDAGVNVSELVDQMGSKFWKDQNIGGATSVTADPDSVFAFIPGTNQLVTYQNAMPNGSSNGNTSFMQVPHPFIPGLSFAVRIKAECTKITAWIENWYKVCQVPIEAYKPGHEFVSGPLYVNGLFHYGFRQAV